MEVIVKFHGDLSALGKELGAEVERLGGGYAILTLDEADVPRLYSYPEIQYIELPKSFSLNIAQGMAAACITPVRGEGSGYGLTGRGVAVGIIDSGVDYTHPEFITPGGESRIHRLWDQTGSGAAPAGFAAGAEYTGEELTAALNSPDPHSIIPATDIIGHGTAVACIAAGNSGVAAEAAIIAVKLGERGRRSFARTTEIMRALKYISDRARELRLPVAINLSFGANDGSHAGDSLFETYIDSLAARWKCVIVAATGNEGAAGHHCSGRAESDLTDSVSFTVGENINSLYLAMWKSFADTFDLELVAPNGDRTGVLDPRVSYRRLSTGGARVDVFYGRPSFYSGGQEVYFRFSGQNGPVPPGLWRLEVTGRDITEGTYHIWLPTTEEVGRDTAFTDPDPHLTITLPATAKSVVSVGGYSSGYGVAVDFSGRGEDFDAYRGKPDLVAPAVEILTANLSGGYSRYSGTSMAAPFVTGAAVLMMQWGVADGNDIFLYGQRVKAFLQRSAKRIHPGHYPGGTWGYGALCLKDAIDALY